MAVCEELHCVFVRQHRYGLFFPPIEVCGANALALVPWHPETGWEDHKDRPLLSTAPHNKVTIIAIRHSGMLLAGIQKSFLDNGRRRYDERDSGHLFLHR